MPSSDTSFFVTGGTLRPDSASYVERQADRDLCRGMEAGEFCYVLTSRQMGKSSLMVRTAAKLRAANVNVAVVDLTAIGQNLTLEQWYNGLLLRIDSQLSLHDRLDEFWMSETRRSPLQRFMAAIQEVALRHCTGQIVIFIDEIDVVRSLPFPTDEFFAAIRECYNRRVQDPQLNRLTFCLLGVATPAELIRDPHTTPFNIGHRIDLADFTDAEALPFASRLHGEPGRAAELLQRVLHWTGGHPYLTQRLCRALAEEKMTAAPNSELTPNAVDAACDQLFLSPRARSLDDNLLFVRDRLLRSEADLSKLLSRYEQVWDGAAVPDDEGDDLTDKLRLSGITRAMEGRLRVRNRVYERVFDREWIKASRPDAVLELAGGDCHRLEGTCSIGRGSNNDLPLVDGKVSRRHALIQAQHGDEFWLMDLGSSNGTFVNGQRISQPVQLRNNDRIEVGPFSLIFRQALASASSFEDSTLGEQTVFLTKADNKKTGPSPGPGAGA